MWFSEVDPECHVDFGGEPKIFMRAKDFLWGWKSQCTSCTHTIQWIKCGLTKFSSFDGKLRFYSFTSTTRKVLNKPNYDSVIGCGPCGPSEMPLFVPVINTYTKLILPAKATIKGNIAKYKLIGRSQNISRFQPNRRNKKATTFDSLK